MADEGALLPSNYVTFLDLKQRWLQQQQQSSSKSNPPHPHQSTSAANDAGANQPKQAIVHDSGSRNPRGGNTNRIKPYKNPVRRGRNSNRIVNQLKPVHDSGSKSPKDVVPRGKKSNRIVNQVKPVHDSGSKSSNDTGNRIVNQLKPVHDDSASKTLAQVADDQEHVNNQSKSKLKKKRKKKKNPRFVTDQKQTTEPEPEKEKKGHGCQGYRVVTDQKQTGPEPVQERKQHGGRRNQEVREPKGKTAPFAQNVVDQDESVKELNDRTRLGSGRFNGGRNNRRDSGRFQSSKHPVPLQIWVRKGEPDVSPSF